MHIGKVCAKCREYKAATYFARSSASVDGMQGYCLDCMRQAVREHYARRHGGPGECRYCSAPVERTGKRRPVCDSCAEERLRLANQPPTCRNGHIRSDENTYLSPGGQRQCKDCREARYPRSDLPKTCAGCGSTKQAPEFSTVTRSLDGLHSRCKACAEEQKRNAPSFATRRFRRYNITKDDYDAMLNRQGERCAICQSEDPQTKSGVWSIDHDHACCPIDGGSCGQCVRGLLCGPCNQGLGGFKDNAASLLAAVEYLTKD